MRQSATRLTILALLLGLVFGALATPAAAAPGSNAENAKLCQKGGWDDLQGTDGTRFANQDACVSYAAHGGTLQAVPTATLTLTYDPRSSTGNVFWVEGAGFTPGASITLTQLTSSGYTYTNSNFDTVLDDGSFDFGAVYPCGVFGAELTLTATDGINTDSDTISFRC